MSGDTLSAKAAVESAALEGVVERARPALLTYRRALLYSLGAFAAALVLALAGIVLTKAGARLFLPISTLLAITVAFLYTLWRASAAWLRSLVIPVLSLVTALIIAGLIIVATDQKVMAALPTFQQNPQTTLEAAWEALKAAYIALLHGSVGDPAKISEAIETWILEGDGRPMLSALRPFGEGLVNSVPLIFAGLAVALGFQAGLFNIGAEGQLILGGLCSVVVGYTIPGLPWVVHLPLALLAGALAGGLWASIAGFLKARTGAHEVINTIMLNYVAIHLTEWLLKELQPIKGTHRTPDILPSAYLPRLFPHPLRINAGFILALLAALLIHWLLYKTTWGFELRTVGANPDAARYGGMSIAKNIVLAMFISGALAGLGGAGVSLGITHNMTLGFSAGYGFDSIALALLGGGRPLGVVLASILFGALKAGGTRMQSTAAIPTELIQIMQAMVIAFIAAPAIIRTIYRLKAERAELAPTFTRGWGQH
ncbi:MAG: ABC transporter permease [Anaerolineae bacterium]